MSRIVTVISTSYAMVARVVSTVEKWQRHEADHHLHLVPRLIMMELNILFPYPLMAW
jgi:hypothetical protein